MYIHIYIYIYLSLSLYIYIYIYIYINDSLRKSLQFSLLGLFWWPHPAGLREREREREGLSAHPGVLEDLEEAARDPEARGAPAERREAGQDPGQGGIRNRTEAAGPNRT